MVRAMIYQTLTMREANIATRSLPLPVLTSLPMTASIAMKSDESGLVQIAVHRASRTIAMVHPAIASEIIALGKPSASFAINPNQTEI
jgi:hypothetical protein